MTLVYIRVSGTTSFILARLFFIRRDFFLFGRDFFTMVQLYAVAHFLIAGSNNCLEQYLSNMTEIAVERS